MPLECAVPDGKVHDTATDDVDELGSLADIVDVDAMSDSAPPLVVLQEDVETILDD